MHLSFSLDQIQFFQQAAIDEAIKAFDQNEVPIGAIITNGTDIIGRGFNKTESLKDPTAHAEILAIKDATNNKQNWRLNDCALFVTVEPCTMCAGAIVNSRINTLIFGVSEPRTGAVGSIYNVLDNYCDARVIRGVMEEQCKELLEKFFKARRQ
jgi:tRNA(adenine34) deaminase